MSHVYCVKSNVTRNTQFTCMRPLNCKYNIIYNSNENNNQIHIMTILNSIVRTKRTYFTQNGISGNPESDPIHFR